MLQPAKSLHGQRTNQPSQKKSTLSSQRLTQKKQQNSMQPCQSQRPALIYVPINADCRNQNFGRVWGLSLTMRWPKSMLVKSTWNPRSKPENPLLQFPTCERRRASKMMIEPIRWWERMCDEWWWKRPPTLTYIYIHQWGCVTHLLGLQAYITIMADLAHKWN